MKRTLIVIAVMLLVIMAVVCHAQTVSQFPNGISTGKVYDYNTSTGWVGSYYMDIPTLTANDTFVGADTTQTLTNKTLTSPTITGTLTHSRERSFGLPLMGFILSDSSPVTASTAPGIEVDDSIPNIVWADGETTPVMITFRIPSDYSSGGAFRLICTESDSTTPNQVDFDVYINKDGVAADSSATGQTPVALAGTASTPDVVTLTPATDQASFSAGAWVTLRMWRDNVATGTGDLEVKGVEFFYTASN